MNDPLSRGSILVASKQGIQMSRQPHVDAISAFS
jgi:hypothetical protein